MSPKLMELMFTMAVQRICLKLVIKVMAYLSWSFAKGGESGLFARCHARSKGKNDRETKSN